MGISLFERTFTMSLFFIVFILITLTNSCHCSRKLTSLYEPPPMSLSYHNGPLLEGDVHVSILWYGQFTPPQQSIVSDFLLSLNPTHSSSSSPQPSVSKWWNLVQTYMKRAGKKETDIVLSNQTSDKNYSLGKILKKSHITELANKVINNSRPGGLTIVLTDKEVAVEGFCMSNCGFHGSNSKQNSAFIWVGNSVTQCPGQCAWPFHQPIYGPQTTPLGAPNGDVGVDGMVVNIAGLLAGTATNPFGNGYYAGSMEVGSVCTGVYGKGAYPGYAGELLVDSSSGASYNAVGVNRRKYLLPALFDPLTSQCLTIV
ncbi:conserved hypothetical protein [Ricinus communis]|uniref:Protein EXORDIUM n=1 Tax=Ricinus communis TaxID=3988 RepID=B9RJM1_RICCO|nr:conserved hypothetical protein [Ricinus communis]|eukprot:XP_002513940.1 protein EXORDIUM-like 1 [Ricinus communis]